MKSKSEEKTKIILNEEGEYRYIRIILRKQNKIYEYC
jgi:hypothetical protein